MLTFRNIVVLLFLTLVQSTLASSHARHHRPQSNVANRSNTNAKRLAAGLPLLPPRSLSGPTRVQHKRSTPSSVSCNYNNKYIRVYQPSSSNFLGYVKNSFPADGSQEYAYGLTNDPNAAMQISFDSPCTGSSTVEITISGSSVYPYLGFAGGDLVDGSQATCGLVGTSHTDHNAPPSPVGNTYSNVYPNSESFLWNFDTTTSILTAQWVNSDSSKPGSTLWWDPSGKSYLQLVGDTVSFTLAHPNAGSVMFVVTSN